MVIYFLRHASAGNKQSNDKGDEKRPLDKEGLAQCRAMGRALAATEVQVELVLSSPLKRAAQTASLVGTEMGYRGDARLDDALRPDASYEQFQDMLQKYSKSKAIMVVGHNPTLSEFCSALLSSGANLKCVELKKGAVARVERSGKNSAVLNWCLTPKLVRTLQASETPRSKPKTVRK
jgi:phosphohistidine phosphatase